VKLPSTNLVALFEKLFQVTSTKKRQQEFTDKHLFDELVVLAQSQDLEMRELSTHTLMLLANLSYSKHNKALFVSNKEIHRAVMATLTAPKAHH
jgi:hypothetical protein